MTDHEFVLTVGPPLLLTLDSRYGDTFEDDGIWYVVRRGARPNLTPELPPLPAELIRIRKAHVLVHVQRDRLVRDRTPEEDKALLQAFRSSPTATWSVGGWMPQTGQLDHTGDA